MLTATLKKSIAAAAAIGIVLLVMIFVHRGFEQRSLAQLQERERPTLALHTENLSGWLGRFRPLAATYAHFGEIAELLDDPDDPARLNAINAQLERWTAASGAADTYILDRDGVVIASSNWEGPVSFVGNSYAFRPYFQAAMQGRLGRYFAVGNTSGIRGYFFAYPVLDGGPAIGVVVVKVRIALIEQDLRASTHEVFVTDPDGVILLAGHPRWRLKTIANLDDETRQRIERSKQFRDAPLSPVEIDGLLSEPLVRARPDRSNAEVHEFLHLSQAMPVEDWKVHMLVDTSEARKSAFLYTLLVGSAALVASLVGFVFWQRRLFYMGRLAEREQERIALERRVVERTADLSKTNQRLATEVQERTQAEEILRQTQADLVQAGKLAALGQMSTALSHEFNQPLAAIRTYAENANAFLERGQTEKADENLTRISRLTERMAQLSKHLTAFARKPKDTTGPISVKAALSEAIELLRARLERSDVSVEIEGLDDLVVVGGQVRLQHVFLNLIGNAIDATASVETPRIVVTLRKNVQNADIVVEDNGTGFADDDVEMLFDPFFTRKEPGKGLGLGLSITFNIVRDFGGVIRAENITGGGARFIVSLVVADTRAEAAE